MYLLLNHLIHVLRYSQTRRTIRIRVSYIFDKNNFYYLKNNLKHNKKVV